MSVHSIPTASTDTAVIEIDITDSPDEGRRSRSMHSISDNLSLPSTSFISTEVDEYSVKPVHDNPLLPHDVVEDRSEIESIPYTSKASFLCYFASEGDRFLMFLASICGIAAGVSYLAHMFILGDVVNTFTRASNTTDVFAMIGDDSIKYVILAACVFILSTLNMYLWCVVKERKLKRLRQLLVQSLFNKDIAWFDQKNATSICAERLSDIEEFGRGIGEPMAMSIQWISAVLALLINALVQSPDVTGVIFPYFPCIIFAAVGSFWITKSYVNRENESKKLVKMALIPALKNIRIISAFQSQDFEMRRIFKMFTFARHMTFRKYLCFGITNGSFWMLAFFTLATGGWYGSYLILQGRMTPGKTIQAIVGLLMSAIFVGQFYPCLECIMKATDAVSNLTKVLDESPVINQNQKKGKDFPDHFTDIEFSNVFFSYPSGTDQRVLDGLQLNIKANETVALVGPTGSGKSTVLQLILRFYDPKKGQVLINGTNLQDIKLQNLRRHIGVVNQKPSLMSCSIADNIRLGHEAVTINQIINAAKLANAHDFIINLPMGYNTMVGEGGSHLKEDEKLRISIARALVRNPQILLLDEVTSFLDEANKGPVLEAIEKARMGRTTVMTSHRLMNIQHADTIAVIQDGRVFEQGSHKKLMEKGGLYYEMWTVQSCMPKGKMGDYIFEIKVDYSTKKGNWNDKNWIAVYSQRQQDSNPEPETCEKIDPIEPEDNEVPRYNFSLMKRLLELNFPDWSYAAIGSVTSLAIGLIGPLFAVFLAEFIYIFSMTDADAQYTARRNSAAHLMVVGAFLAPLNYLQNFCFAQTDSKLTMYIRRMTCKALFKQDMSFFDDPKHTPGRLMKFFLQDAVDMNGATALKLAAVLQLIATVIGSIAISFAYSWQLAFPMLGIFCPTLFFLNYFTGRLYWPEKVCGTNKYQNLIKNITQEAFENIRTMVTLVKEEYFIRKCRGIFNLMYKKKMKEAIKFGILFGLNEGIVYCAFAVAFSIGSYLVHNKMADFPSVFRVLGTVVIGSIMAGRVFWNTHSCRKGRIAAKRLLPLIEQVPKDSATEEENEPLEQCKGSVSFENVTFAYPTNPDAIILKNLSFSINSGETVAIVGANEVEKKAIVELTERFYVPGSGAINLDNVNIQSTKLNWLRSQLCILKQEALFTDISITDNIIYGSTAGINEVIETCKLLKIHDFFISLPAGYNTNLEEIVLPFHTQRILVARAMVRDSQVVFVDCESLSLNLPSEKEIRDTLFRALKEKTTILLANSVSVAESADKVLLINQGKIAEAGSHEELMATEGIYYRLVKSQKDLKERL